MTRHKTLIAAIAIFWIGTGIVLGVFLSRHNVGRVVYALDDAYIHMAIARNLSGSGVFGVTAESFTSCSSSPFWTVLLAGCFRLFGVHEALPLLLNLAFGTLLLADANRMATLHIQSRRYRFLFLLGLLFVTPMIPMVAVGMEHVLHIWISLIFLWRSSAALARETGRLEDPMLYLAAALLPTVRIEGVFAVAVVCLLLLFQRRLSAAVLLGAVGALPLLVFAAVSVAHGAFPLPTSVIAKANRPESFSPGDLLMHTLSGIHVLVSKPHLLLLVTLACVSLLVGASLSMQVRALAAIFVPVCLLHTQFAKTGWFYRYEAYLVATGFFVNALAAPVVWPKLRQTARAVFKTPAMAMPAFAVAVLAVVYPLGLRAGASLWQTPRAMANIYEQQYQMGRFVRRYYPNASVALNDIGAVCFLADIRVLDLIGLASPNIAAMRMKGTRDAAAIEALAAQRQTRIAVVYDDGFAGHGRLPPASWIAVAKWSISRNIVCQNDTVVFYATDTGEAALLRERLERFACALPPGVAVSWVNPKGASS